MKDNRPINLNLLKFHFPVMAITSILHRITGVVIFLAIPAFLYILHASLISQAHFTSLENHLAHPASRFFLWAALVCVIYHLFAGIRHLVMDIGLGDSLTAGRVTSWLVILFSIVAAVLLGVWLW